MIWCNITTATSLCQAKPNIFFSLLDETRFQNSHFPKLKFKIFTDYFNLHKKICRILVHYETYLTLHQPPHSLLYCLTVLMVYRQLGTRQLGTRTTGHGATGHWTTGQQDNWAPGQLGTRTTGHLTTADWAPGQLDTGQLGTRQLGTRSTGHRTTGHQDNWVPGQLGTGQLGTRTTRHRTTGLVHLLNFKMLVTFFYFFYVVKPSAMAPWQF